MELCTLGTTVPVCIGNVLVVVHLQPQPVDSVQWSYPGDGIGPSRDLERAVVRLVEANGLRLSASLAEDASRAHRMAWRDSLFGRWHRHGEWPKCVN